MTASGGRLRRHVPIRTCIACRTARAKRDLVRVVRTPDRRVVLDPSGKVPGRGAYLCADGACWQAALERGSIARALEIHVPADLAALLVAGPTSTTKPMNEMTTEGGARGPE